jgi:hypothetical protein
MRLLRACALFVVSTRLTFQLLASFLIQSFQDFPGSGFISKISFNFYFATTQKGYTVVEHMTIERSRTDILKLLADIQ